MATHSPAPWKFTGFSKPSNFADHVAVVQGDNTVIARVKGGVTQDRDIASANATLIAAAPDMLAALKEISRNAALSDAWLEPVRAAIAKAEAA